VGLEPRESIGERPTQLSLRSLATHRQLRRPRGAIPIPAATAHGPPTHWMAHHPLHQSSNPFYVDP
jgi:hypothetical protein